MVGSALHVSHFAIFNSTSQTWLYLHYLSCTSFNQLWSCTNHQISCLLLCVHARRGHVIVYDRGDIPSLKPSLSSVTRITGSLLIMG
jgi:hypothetical protein